MAKGVHIIHAVGQLAHIAAVCQADPLRNSNHNGLFFLQKTPYLLHKLLHIKGKLRQINEIRPFTILSLGKSGCTCEPSGIPSHDLNDSYKSLSIFQGIAVADDLLCGGSDVLGSTSVARCVIGQSQIVVNGLGNADELCGIALYNGVIGKLFDGVHGVVAADVNKALDLQLVQDPKDLFKNFRIFMDFR